jgi:hypothetical protein
MFILQYSSDSASSCRSLTRVFTRKPPPLLLRYTSHWRHCSYAQPRVEFASVGKIAVKGKAEKLEVFIPIKEKPQASRLMHANAIRSVHKAVCTHCKVV